MIIPVYISERIFIPRIPTLTNCLDEIRKKFTYANPEFVKRKILKKWTGNIDRSLNLWLHIDHPVLGESLAIPRGGIKKLKLILAKYNHQPSFIDERLSLQPITHLYNDIELREDQKRLAKAMFTTQNCLIRSPTASGKCLHPDTPVLLYSGKIVKASQITNGDLLMGPDSTPRQVSNCHCGYGPLYKVIPIKGDPWICNQDHILTLIHTQTNQIIDISLQDYINSNKTFKHEHKLFKIIPFQMKQLIQQDGFKIQKIDPGQYVGWTLDKDGRFLLGDFTVTHNTETSLKVVEWILKDAGPVLIIVWETDLMNEWIDRAAQRFGIRKSEIGILGGGKTKRVMPITVGMQQTLRKCIRKYSHQFGGVIADEVQRFAATTFRDVIDVMPAKYRIGISADETRKDKNEFFIYDIFGEVADEIAKSSLIDNGSIHDVIIRLIPTGYNLTVFSKSEDQYMEWAQIDSESRDFNKLLDDLCEDENRNLLAWEFMKPAVELGHSLLLVTHRVNHAIWWDTFLRSQGVKCGLMLGGTEYREEFKTTKNGLRNGTLQAGVGTLQKIGQGLDIPRWDRGYILTPAAGNKQQFEQIVGRLRRTHPDKKDAICYYMYDELIYGYHKKAIKKNYQHVFIYDNGEFLPVS
jgi:hypothetical protein